MATELSQTYTQIINGLDPDCEELQPFLNNLQANILKFHGRNRAYHLLLRFGKDQAKVKAWIRAYAQDSDHGVTSAAKQLKDIAEKEENRDYTGGLLGCFFLSADGYRALGYEEEQLRELFPESLFINGMKAHQNYIYRKQDQWYTMVNKDPHPKNWQESYQNEIHAMLLLAQNCDEAGPEDIVEPLKNFLESKGIAKVVAVEHGRRLWLPNDKTKDIEHFGYRDGISNPSFFSEKTQANQKIKFDFSLASRLVLVPDLLAGGAPHYGSYFVFRKLEQDRDAFGRLVRKSATHGNGQAQLLSGARIVGRFTDGTPLTKFSKPLGPEIGDTIDFDFDGDNGSRCPLSAHIRKTNPRNGSERNRQIVRRGLPYIEIDDKTGEEKVGLLFMCYQLSIHRQFEFIQRVWIDNRSHPVEGTGVDRLIGHDWSEKTNFKRPITLKGGEYFFAPSLNFLKNIG